LETRIIVFGLERGYNRLDGCSVPALARFICRDEHWAIYEGRSINKLQNGAIPSVLKIGKIRNIRFVGNLILNIHTTFLDADVIIVTSAAQSICVLFSPSMYYLS